MVLPYLFMSYKGIYKPENPKKYIGDANQIVYRSLWERKMFRYCDTNEKILKWASEEIAIRYFNPVKKRVARYFPDIYIEYINKEGKTTDKDGKLVDSEGRYIDEEGNFIDKYGNRVDGEGEYVAEFEPFLDDEGNPVVVEEETASSAKSEEKSEDKPKKSTRAKKSPKAAAE